MPTSTDVATEPVPAPPPPGPSRPAPPPPDPPQPPIIDGATDPPWWTRPTPTQPTRGKAARPSGSGTPRPSARPVSKPTTAPKTPSRWKPWVVVSVIAVLAIAGAITTVAVLRPPVVEQILTGSTSGPVDPDELSGQPTDSEAAGVFVKQEAVFLADYDWTYTQVVCNVGDEYRITAKADGAFHEGTAVGPDGLGDTTEQAPYPDHPLAALLVGVRGSNTLELVGADGTYTCPSQSEMKLGANDDTHLEGNAGQFTVTIWKLSGQ
jgi:hypothetical protein